MEAIGIDIGSNKAVMAVVKKGGIDIVLTDTSGRQCPVQVAYTDQERLIGESVRFQIKKNLKSTILFPTRFLGLNSECKEQLAIEAKFCTHKVVELENKKIGFEVVQMGNKHTFTVEQVLAFYLFKLKKFYEKAEINCKDLVVSVPSYCSNVERQSLLDACEIAGLKCLRVINESTAIALQYGFFRKKELDTKETRVVAFVDFGHSKTTVTIASFIQGKTKIICHKSDRNLGARDLDLAIIEQVGGEFATKVGSDPRKNPRCVVRMFEAVEKSRKMLSSVSDAQLNIDYLLEEEDLNRTLTRDEFEKLIDPYTRRFADLLKATLAESGLNTDQIHSVEMIGDATRTPIILDISKQIFGKHECLRTLNSLETVARGTALQSAMLSPLFSVSSFIVEEYNPLPVSITYRFGSDGAPVTKELFPKGSMFPLTKTVTFDNKIGDMDLLVHYSPAAEILHGLPNQIAQYMIKAGKPKHAESPFGGSKVKFQFKVCNNIHQIPCLESTELIEEWTEEEKIAIKKPVAPTPAPAKEGEEKKDAAPVQEASKTEQDFEIKQKRKTRSEPINFETQAHALPPGVRQQFKSLEDQLFIDDRKFLDQKEARNTLEAYAYEFKNNLQEYGNFVKHADENTRISFLKTIGEVVEWIYAAGETAKFEEYEKRLIDFRAVGEPIKKRYIFYSTVEDSFKRFGDLTNYIQTQLEAIPHLTDFQRQSVIFKLEHVQVFMSKLRHEIDSNPQYNDPSTTLSEVENKIDILKAEAKGIFSAPPPKPEIPTTASTEPPKESEPVAEAETVQTENKDDLGADAEMN